MTAVFIVVLRAAYLILGLRDQRPGARRRAMAGSGAFAAGGEADHRHNGHGRALVWRGESLMRGQPHRLDSVYTARIPSSLTGGMEFDWDEENTRHLARHNVT